MAHQVALPLFDFGLEGRWLNRKAGEAIIHRAINDGMPSVGGSWGFPWLCTSGILGLLGSRLLSRRSILLSVPPFLKEFGKLIFLYGNELFFLCPKRIIYNKKHHKIILKNCVPVICVFLSGTSIEKSSLNTDYEATPGMITTSRSDKHDLLMSHCFTKSQCKNQRKMMLPLNISHAV